MTEAERLRALAEEYRAAGDAADVAEGLEELAALAEHDHPLRQVKCPPPPTPGADRIAAIEVRMQLGTASPGEIEEREAQRGKCLECCAPITDDWGDCHACVVRLYGPDVAAALSREVQSNA
jgi:hypothetical protein